MRRSCLLKRGLHTDQMLGIVFLHVRLDNALRYTFTCKEFVSLFRITLPVHQLVSTIPKQWCYDQYNRRLMMSHNIKYQSWSSQD